MNSANNAGALTTLPGGVPFNPFNFSNAFNNSNGQSINMGNGQFPATANNDINTSHYGAPMSTSQQPSNGMTSVYPANNQLFNSLMPLASIAAEPNPSVSMADVSQHGNKLDQLSTNVEAMQHGIDSLIEGMGLDPLSAASLRDGQDANNALNGLTNNVNGNNPPAMIDTTNGNSNAFQTHPTVKDDTHHQPPTSLLDFDLDSLLKQLGAAAASSTPPHISALSDFSQSHNNPFDTAMFNDMEMFNPNSNANANADHGHGQDQNFGMQTVPIRTDGQSSGFLNEVTSPSTMKRSGSSEPSLSTGVDAGGMDIRANSPSSRAKKRKAETYSVDDIAPSTQPKQTNRGSKRRK